MSQRSISQNRHRYANLVATLSLSAAVALASANAVAQQPEHAHSADHSAGYGQQVAASNPAAQRKAAIDSTESFISAHKQWAQARGASNKAAALENLMAKAEARRDMLAELIKTNPAEALRVAIPEDKQTGMPAAVLEMLEQRLEVEGEMEVIIEDYADGSNKLRHILKTPFGERFELHLSVKNKHFQSGTRVNVYGLLLDGSSEENGIQGDIAISANPDDLLTLAADGGTSGGSNGGTAALPDTMGQQNVLVMLVNFQDDKSQPWSKAQIQNTFSTVDDFIRENSYQQTSLNVKVTDWNTIPHSSSTCDRYAMVDDALAAASASGIDVSAYNRHVLMFPRNSCSYQGLGTVGGSPSITWLNGTSFWFTAAHEIGHNLGLYHSHDMVCNGSTLGDSCSTNEYGDYPDIMGSGQQGHFNAFQKDRLGWLGHRIQTVTSDGVYQMSSLEQDSNLPLALKVLKGIDPNNGLEFWYYLESRKSFGFDSWLSTSSSSFDKGVGIRMGTMDYGNTSYLLDMKPQTADFLDAALEPGQSFSDGDSGVDIYTESVSNGVATVSVQPGAPQTGCTATNPTLTVTPNQSQWVAAGTTVNYQLTVTNNDSATCNNSSFNLSGAVPSGWIKAFNSSSLNLAPGQSATATLSVASSATAADGFYNIDLTASNVSYSASGTVTYVVDTPITSNNAPIANSDSAVTDAGVAVTIPVLNNDSDPDGDNLSITSVSGVNGTATINNGNITFTPASGFSGTEVFNYSISDGNGGSATAPVSVTVSPVASNNAPVANNDSATTDEGVAVNIPVLNNDSDPDGDSLTVITVNGVNGTAIINNDGTITFTPANGFSGNETFSYVVSDDSNASATATVSVTVNPVITNKAPVANNDSATTDEGISVNIPVLNNDSDPDGDSLTVITVNGVNGTAVINNDGTITFTPAYGFSGNETFSYVVSDDSNASATATVSVTVNPVNQAPVANNDSATTDEGVAVNIPVLNNDSDPDGDSLTVTSVSGVNGTAVINNNGTIVFTPANGFSGNETFSYVVSDGNGNSATATVSVTVNPVNKAPIANNDSATTDEGVAVNIPVLNNDSDPDGDSLTVTSVSGVNGTAVINNNGTITFTPANGFSGNETFSYVVSDGNGNSATATVSVTVNPVNKAPVANNDSATTDEGVAVNIPVLNNDSDPDGDSLTVTSVSGVSGTAVINNNGTITFTPANGFSGTETFSYVVSDGNGNSATATVSVTVNPVNKAPVASNDSATTDEGVAVNIQVLNNDSDPDGDSLTVTSVSGVNGTAVINNNGTLTFTPASGFSGNETFSYVVSDGNGGSDSANVTVTVNDVPVDTNSAPIAVNDSVTMPSVADITITALANDWDPEGDTLTVQGVTQGAKGSVRINSDGTLTYIPGKRFKNADSFSYTISDGAITASATVTVQLQKSSGGTGSSGGKGNGNGKKN